MASGLVFPGVLCFAFFTLPSTLSDLHLNRFYRSLSFWVVALHSLGSLRNGCKENHGCIKLCKYIYGECIWFKFSICRPKHIQGY